MATEYIFDKDFVFQTNVANGLDAIVTIPAGTKGTLIDGYKVSIDIKKVKIEGAMMIGLTDPKLDGIVRALPDKFDRTRLLIEGDE